MQNDNINPIHHGAFSKATGTVAGAAGGALKSGASGYLKTTLVTGLVVGGIAATMALTGGLGAVGFGALGTLSNALVNFGIFGAIGTAIGAFTTGIVGGGIASWIGAVKGGSNAATRIRNEQGAANMVDAQLSAYQAQAYAASAAPTTVYAPSAANNNYPTASTMNQAGTKVQADSAMDLGIINGQQLAAAR